MEGTERCYRKEFGNFFPRVVLLTPHYIPFPHHLKPSELLVKPLDTLLRNMTTFLLALDELYSQY